MKHAAAKAALGRAPATTVTLRPIMWAQTYDRAPTSNEIVGLRTLSEDERATAVRQAAESVKDFDGDEDDRVELYNRALLCWIVGAALCDPNNAALPSVVGDWSDDVVRERLTAETLRFLFETWELACVEVSPLSASATDRQIQELLLLDYDALPDPEARRAKRLLAYVHEIVFGLGPDDEG